MPRKKVLALSATELARRERQRSARLELRAQAIAVYGGRCVECGTTEDLEFDHVNNDGQEHRLWESNQAMLSRIVRGGEPIRDFELQLLCAFHHDVKSSPVRGRRPIGAHVTEVMLRLDELSADQCRALRAALDTCMASSAGMGTLATLP